MSIVQRTYIFKYKFKFRCEFDSSLNQLVKLIQIELDNYSWGKDEEEEYIKDLIPLLKPIIQTSFDMTEALITGVKSNPLIYSINKRKSKDGKLIMYIGKDSRLNVRRFFRQFGPAKLSFWTSNYVTVSYPKDRQTLKMLNSIIKNCDNKRYKILNKYK